MYDPSGFHDDLIDRCIQAQCQYIVCGAPVGSIQLQRQNVNSKVHSSIALQLDDLRHIFLTPNGVLKKDTQTIYQIIQPCVPSQLPFYYGLVTLMQLKSQSAVFINLLMNF